MKNRSKQRHASHLICNNQGAAALIAIIVITAMIVVISVSLGLATLSQLEIGFSEQRGDDVLVAAESCTEEAVLRLSRDNTYSGGSLTVGDIACTITVTGTPCGTCTISSEASAVGYTRRIEAGVSVTGNAVDIQSWEEVD